MSPASALPLAVVGAGGEGARPPVHVAIIMDGNGRWAKTRHLPRIAGHRRGADAVRRTVRAAGELGIEVLTLYAFSSENWRRPAEEVSDLMGLLRHFLKAELAELVENGVRMRTIGDLTRLSPDVRRLLEEARIATAEGQRMTLVLALNYGAQDEITRAMRAIGTEVAAGTLDPAAIDAEAITARLDTADLPPPDLLIRTSGERRLSNFLLWQAAYAELLFVETLWPDFDADHLAAAVADFSARDRRFGGL